MKLPLTCAALRDGVIDLARARLITLRCLGLTPQEARRAEAVIFADPDVGEWSPGVMRDRIARKLVLARSDAIAHQQLLNELSNVDLLVIDDFLTVGIDHDAAADLFAILANRDHRLPTMIASQTGPAHWVAELPDRIAADSIVNRLANRARTINLGDIDMRKLRHDQTRANNTYWE